MAPGESWRALEGPGGSERVPGRTWGSCRVWEGFPESLGGLGKVLGGVLGKVLGAVLGGS